MPMREAVAYLEQKVRTPTRRWTDLYGPAHTRAFAVAGVQADDLLAGIKAGVAASAVLVLGGTTTAPGTVSLLIHGRRVDVAVASGTAAAAVATAIGAAINANLDLLVSAAVATTNVTVTARARGLEGNFIDIRHSAAANEALPAGLTLTTPAMASGTLSPTADLGAALDALGDVWFTDIISNWSDVGVLAALESRLSSQFGPMQMRDCHAWAARPEATFSALASYGAARNSPHISIMGFRNSPTPPWEWAAVTGAVCIAALAIDPARPVQTLALPGLIAPVAARARPAAAMPR